MEFLSLIGGPVLLGVNRSNFLNKTLQNLSSFQQTVPPDPYSSVLRTSGYMVYRDGRGDEGESGRDGTRH